MRKTARKMISAVMICTMLITFMPFMGEGYAFAKSDSKPGKIASLTVKTKSKAAKISWAKSKNAKKYQVKVMLGKKKVKALTTKKRSVTVKKLKNNKTYTVYVRGINGKKKGKWKTKRFRPGRAVQPAPETPKPAPASSGQGNKDNGTDPEEPSVDNLKDGVVDKGDLQHLSEQGVIDVSYGESGNVEFIDGSFTNEKVSNVDDAIWVLDETTSFLNGFYAENSRVDEVKSEDNETFYRFSPSYRGLRVIGSQVILSADADGTVTGLTSSFSRKFNDDEDNYIDTETSISEEEARAAAINELVNTDEIQAYLTTYNMTEDAFIDSYVISDNPELVIYAADQNAEPVLVYQVSVRTAYKDVSIDKDAETAPDVDTEVPLISETYFIYANDAQDEKGKVYLKKSSTSGWENISVSAKNISNIGGNTGEQTIDVQKQGNDYRMIDNKRKITVRKTWSSPFYFSPFGYHGNIPSGSTIEDKAVYSMINMEKTYDFYKNVLGRSSYDGRGAEIKVFYDMHDKKRTTVAAWDGEYKSFVIDKDMHGERGLDVLGHEFTHAVMGSINGGLWGIEGGALDEGYPDVMGNLIEGKTDDGRWKLGEDTNSCKYNMADSVEYVSQYGSHYNAQVFAHAAYLMMNDSSTVDISREEWAKVFYKSMYYLTSDATFIQARRAVLCAANRSGFDHDEQMAIREAFAAVGIREPQALRIVLNWGSEPEDLDSHLVGPRLDNEGSFHIYYPNKTYFDNDQKKFVADLDYDDTTSYGPEVTTIHGKYPGTYYFYVHDFTTGTDSESEVMGNSGATVKIFKDGSNLPLEEVFSIRKGAKGTVWTVCKIEINDSGDPVITKIDKYGTEPLDENGNEIEVDYYDDDSDDDY